MLYYDTEHCLQRNSAVPENLVPIKDCARPDKESANPTACGTEPPFLHEGESTPPPETLANAIAKGSGTKGKDVTSSHGDHGYTFVP
jgi:hypothetical protein